MPADASYQAIDARPAASASRLAGWTVFLSILVFGPIFIFQYPGLQDYPNHIARAFILLHRSDPILERLYSVQWTMLPNLGWDIWAVTAGQILSLEYAGKIFLMLGSASILLGCFVLNRVLQERWTFAPLLVVPFLFNIGFAKGFLSFNLGVGCALLAIASWISIGEKRWPLRLVVATLFSTLLYVIHFYGWAFYGIFVLGLELQAFWRSKAPKSAWLFVARLGRDGLQAVPALTMMGYAVASTHLPFTVKKFQPPYIRIGEIVNLIDVGNYVANFFFVTGMALLIFILLRRKWLRFRFDAALPLLFCLLLFFVLPNQIAGTDLVGWRILLPALAVGIASLAPSKEADSRVDHVMSRVTLATVAIVGIQVWSWHNSEIGRENFLRLITNVPDGSALFIVHNGITENQLMRRSSGLYHVGAYAVLAKRALVQSMFVFPGQQPLRFRDPMLQSMPGNSFTFLRDVVKEFKKVGYDISSYVARFDYVVVHGPSDGEKLGVLSAENLTLVNRVDDFWLYQVRRTQAVGTFGASGNPADHAPAE